MNILWLRRFIVAAFRRPWRPLRSERNAGTSGRSLWPSDCRSSAGPRWRCRRTESPSRSTEPRGSRHPGLPDREGVRDRFRRHTIKSGHDSGRASLSLPMLLSYGTVHSPLVGHQRWWTGGRCRWLWSLRETPGSPRRPARTWGSPRWTRSAGTREMPAGHLREREDKMW